MIDSTKNSRENCKAFMKLLGLKVLTGVCLDKRLAHSYENSLRRRIYSKMKRGLIPFVELPQ